QGAARVPTEWLPVPGSHHIPGTDRELQHRHGRLAAAEPGAGPIPFTSAPAPTERWLSDSRIFGQGFGPVAARRLVNSGVGVTVRARPAAVASRRGRPGTANGSQATGPDGFASGR